MPKITLASTLRDRWPARIEGGALKAAAWSAFEAMEKIPEIARTKREALGKRGDLSAKGINARLRQDMAQIVTRDLRAHREAVKERAADLKARRAALTSPKIDRTDLLAELQRQEVRSWLRSMAPEARHVALLGDTDGALVEAVLSAPPALSGTDRLPDVVRRQIVDGYLQARHSETVEAMAHEEDALTVADAALRGALDVLQEAVGLSSRHQFDTWFETGVDPELELADERA